MINLKRPVLFFLILSIVLFGISTAQAQSPEIELKLAETQEKTYPATMGAIEFARLVGERSNGRISVKVFTGGALGSDEKQVLQQVQSGKIDLTRVNISPVTDLAPILNLLQLPYLYEDWDHIHSVIDSEIGAALLSSVEESGLIGLAFYDEGARNFYNSVKPITSIKDLQGMKIRVPQSKLMVEMINSLGAIATPMAFGKVYDALKTNAIDGAENNWPSYKVTKHFEAAKYITEDRHTMAPAFLVGSKNVLNRLAPEDLALIKKAAADSVEYERKIINKKAEETKKDLIAAGIIISKLADRQAFVKAVDPLYYEIAADYMDILEQIMAMGM